MDSTRQAIADDRSKKSQNIQKIHKIFKKFTKYSKNYNTLEFHDHIKNHHGKSIQISTNMPGINSLIREIDVNISEIWESKHNFAQ